MAEAEMADAATKQELASNLPLDILQIVKVSLSQHGLRHGDTRGTGSTARVVWRVCTRL